MDRGNVHTKHQRIPNLRLLYLSIEDSYLLDEGILRFDR